MKSKQTKSTKSTNQELKALIEDAQQTRLYILKRIGPTSFKYCDENDNKFKVTIGEILSCTCNNGQSKQCIHTLHALLKVFKVDPQSHILLQSNYSSYDIQNIVSGQYTNKPTHVAQQPKQQETPQQQQQQQQINKQLIEQDSLCPICQESLNQSEAVVYCKKQCGNNFHAKCMRIWVLQKQASGKKEINCPMCRTDWGQGALLEIRIEEKQFEQLNQTHKRTCQQCKCNPIVGQIYQCIQCPSFALCFRCYQRPMHEHPVFISKNFITDQWTLAGKYSMDSIYQILPQNINGQQTGNELMMIGMQIQKTTNKCNYCLQCAATLRKLPCGHLADDKCLVKFSQNCYICPKDMKPVFLGLYNSLTLEQREQCNKSTTELQLQLQQVEMVKQSQLSLPPINKRQPISRNIRLKQDSRLKMTSIPRQLSANKSRDLGQMISVQQLKNKTPKSQEGQQSITII